MKTLIISKQLDFITHGLAIPLTKIGEIGVTQGYVRDDVEKFKPDLIISDQKYDLSYPHYDIKNLYKLEPFINLDNLKILPKEERYCFDLVYFGKIAGFESVLNEIYKSGINVCHFDTTPSDTVFYNGLVDMKLAYTIYHYSIACPVLDNSRYRLLDIIASDGKPVEYKNPKQFINDCISTFNGKPIRQKMTKDEIINSHTNYDRVSFILESLGFEDSAREVKALK